MNFLDNIGTGISQAIDAVVEKNRYLAYTNRLKYVIRSETETLNRAYIALGKHFYKNLKGDPESAEVQRLCNVIEVAQIRLKKAQDRLEYVIMYGIPEANKSEDVSADTDVAPDVVEPVEEDEGDITICASESAEVPPQKEEASEAVETENTESVQTEAPNEADEDTASIELML